jgi:hypothetical protein
VSQDLVIVDDGVAAGEPITGVSYLEPTETWDSGYACFSVPPNQLADTTTGVMHVHCVLDQQPDVGRGMDVARRHGETIRDGDDWLAA